MEMAVVDTLDLFTMSLKAKIEAVIYASEEPVTLVQLAGLLGEEAQAELDAQAEQQASLPLEETPETADPETLNAETLGEEPPESGEAKESAAEPVAAAEETASGDPAAASRPVSAEAGNPADVAPETPEAGAVEEPGASAEASAAKVVSAAETRARERRLREYFRTLLDELMAEYANGDRGLEIREVAGGFRLATKPEYHDAVRGFVKSLKPPLKLSLQALETLAVVAYKQPVTAPEVSEIRGVDSGGVLGSLMARKLVATAGRKQVIGRPILYKTTKEFLVRFGLKDLNELPSIEEFERMAGEFAEAGEFPVQEEIPMAENEAAVRRSEEDATAGEHGDSSGVEPMVNEHEAQADGVPYSEENLNDEAPHAVEDAGDNIAVDGRNVGIDPDYGREDSYDIDSPAIDAEVQSQEKDGGA